MAYPPPLVPTGNHVPAVRIVSEKKLGILYHTSSIDFGWHGDIRKRWVARSCCPPSLACTDLSFSRYPGRLFCRLGLAGFVSPSLTFADLFNRRYTDFIVNEVRKDGTVVHLTDFKAIDDSKLGVRTPPSSSPTLGTLPPP